MYAGIEGKEFRCTISGHCRTQIFEFPKIDFRPNGDESHHSIYDSPVGSSVCDFKSGRLLRKRDPWQALRHQSLFTACGQ